MDDLKAEMATLYRGRTDPWKYELANRHCVTVGLCQQFWEGGSVLDVPSAEGRLTEKLVGLLQPTPIRVYGVDLIPEALKQGQSRLLAGMDPNRSPGTCLFEVCDLRESFPPWHVDLIVLSDVLPYIPEHAQRIVSDACGRLMPGGTLVMTSWVDAEHPDPCFPELPEGFEIVSTLTWTGIAFDLKEKPYPSKAEYAVVRKKPAELP